MNDDMRAAGAALGDELSFDLVHSHDWLVAGAARKLARRFGCPWLVTVHATEHGRHQGWVKKHPQKHIHGVERRMVRAADRVITCSHYMRGHVAEVFGIDEAKITVVPNGVDPEDLQPAANLPQPARALRGSRTSSSCCWSGRLVYEKGFHLALDALPGVIERVGERALPGRRLGHRRARPQGAGREARAAAARRVPGLDRRRDAALALRDRRPVRDPVAVRAVRARRARGDGLRLPVHRRRHRRAARGRARRRARRPALHAARLRLAGRADGDAC